MKKTSIFDLLEQKRQPYKDVDLQLAAVTHYLHNKNGEEAKMFEQKALAVIDRYAETNAISKETLLDHLEEEAHNVPFAPNSDPEFRFIDLFAGIGGFRMALHNLGGKCVYSNEWDSNAQKTYRENYGDIPFGDVTQQASKDFVPSGFDILCGGFPCQAFSIAGYQKGFSDTRGTLFFDIQQIAEKHRPKVLFLENVKNLVTHDKGNTFSVIIEILEKKLKYKVFHKVLNSMTHANIPHNRERIFIVAFDPKQVPQYDKFSFPDPVPLTKTIHDILLPEKQDDVYYYPKTHKYYPELKKTVVSRDTLYQWRRVYVRENKSNVCPTLTANMGGGGHNVPIVKDDFGIRKLTPRECFRFQGFPDSFSFPNIARTRLYMQAGNSVTMPLIERIARNIVSVL